MHIDPATPTRVAFLAALAITGIAVWRALTDGYLEVLHDTVAAALFVLVGLLCAWSHRPPSCPAHPDDDQADAPLVTPLPDGRWLVHYNGSVLEREGSDYVILTGPYNHRQSEESPQT